MQSSSFSTFRLRDSRPRGTVPGRAMVRAMVIRRPSPNSGLIRYSRDPAGNTLDSAGMQQVRRDPEARPTGFEPVTFGFVDRRSIRLSYGRVRAQA
jgi:hypothetical protein